MMQYIDIKELFVILEYSVTFGGICGMMALLYRFFTTETVRKIHHRRLRIWFYLIYKTSWLEQAKKASNLVCRFLNWIYGSPQEEQHFFSKNYFNKRAWQASFTIALFYLIGFVLFIWSLFKGPDDFENKIQLYLIRMSIFIASYIVFGLIYIGIKNIKKKILKLKRVDQNIYEISINMALAFEIISLLLKPTSVEVSMIFWLIALPLWFVWRYGPFGITVYFVTVIFSLIICIPVNIASSEDYLNIHNGWNDLTKLIYVFSIIGLLKWVKCTYKVTYKKLMLSVFVLSLMVPLVSIYNSINDNYAPHEFELTITLLILILALFLYLWFFAWGLVAANSMADFISSNVSRWLFAKIQNYSKWKHILMATIIDTCIGIALISLTALFLFTLVSTTYPILDKNSSVGLVSMEKKLNALNKSNDISMDDISSKPLLNGLIASLLFIPNIFIPFDMESYFINYSSSPFSDDKNKTFIVMFIFWFFYLSVLIPSIIHFICLMILSIAKISSDILQRPALYLHKLLIEKSSEKNTFSGAVRATGLISIMATLSVISLYIIFKLMLKTV
jgi:hypothetical protein